MDEVGSGDLPCLGTLSLLFGEIFREGIWKEICMNIKLASEQGSLEPTALTQTVCCCDLGTWFREGIWKKGNHTIDEPEDESNPPSLVHTHT